MKTELVIIAFFKNLSRGSVKLNEFQAKKLKDIVLDNEKRINIEIQKFRYNANNQIYELYQTLIIDRENVNNINSKLSNIQYRGFYKYVITEIQFEYYTVNANLYEK